jgi:hypothetical protein
MQIDDTTVEYLNFLMKTYDSLNKMLTSTKNRLAHLKPERPAKYDDIAKALESLKGTTSREMEGLLRVFPIWEKWLNKKFGVGPWIAAALIKEYYFRFIPICKKCGVDLDDDFTCPACSQKAKGEGILLARIERKNFPKISAWWHYMGMHVEDGKKARAHKGESRGGRRGRAIAYHIGEQFEKKNNAHPYKLFYNQAKAKRLRTHPNATPMHRRNMARHETAKLFLAHFWAVARELEELEVTEPYAGKLLGHDVIKPYFWEPAVN